MAKGNMLLGHARGKVGSLVFARQDGKQIVRSRAEVVRNPQTESQMIQRIFLNTIAQAYSNMSELCDHSFEGVPSGQKSMSFFMQKNLKDLRSRVSNAIENGSNMDEIFSFSPIGTSILVPNNYLIAKGTLPSVPVIDNNADDTMAIALSANTYAAVINDYGLQRGDQLTFCAISANGANDATLSFCRVILDPRTASGEEAELSAPFIVDGKVNLPSPRNEGSFNSIAFASGKLAFGFGKDYLEAAAVIVSRQSADGSWKRSTTYFVANEQQTNLYYDLQTTLDMLKEGGLGTLSPRYLNNAGTSTIVEAPAGAGPFEVSVVATDENGQAPTTYGSVTGGGTFSNGADCTLTATTSGNNYFDGWFENGRKLSTANPYTFSVHAAHSIQGRFSPGLPG